MLIVALGGAGCGVESSPDSAPRMPIMVAAALPPPAESVSVQDRVNLARERVMRGEFSAALDAVQPLEPLQRHDALIAVADSVAAAEPRRALEFVAVIPAGPAQAVAAERAATRAMNADLAGTVRWGMRLSDVSARVAVVRAITATLLERSPANGITALEHLDVGEHRIELLTLAASEWASHDRDRALTWARAVGDGDLRVRVLTSVIFAIAQSDPSHASTLTDVIPSGRDRLLVLGAIGRSWAVRNGAAARAWAQSLPVGESRDAARAGIESGFGAIALNSGARGDITSATADGFVATGLAPSFVERREALRREFETRLRTSPALTGDWLLSLPAAERNDDFMRQLAREWLATNPAAARQWIEQNVLSAPERQQLLHEGGLGAGHRP